MGFHLSVGHMSCVLVCVPNIMQVKKKKSHAPPNSSRHILKCTWVGLQENVLGYKTSPSQLKRVKLCEAPSVTTVE